MIYLDNAATTAISPKVMDVLKESMDSDFANPGTIYSIGLDAKKKVERAKQDIVSALNIPPHIKLFLPVVALKQTIFLLRGFAFQIKKSLTLGWNMPVYLSHWHIWVRLGTILLACLNTKPKAG